MKADILVVGGGLGGVAAALAAARAGKRVIMTEEYDWIGGQLTSQAVPSDEHTWVEQFGITRSYRALRNGVRQYYRDHYPLTEGARAWGDLNPGGGWVSRICAEPRVSLAVMESMLMPYIGAGRLTILKPWRPVGADVDGDLVRSVTLRHRDSGAEIVISADYVLDATELGDLLPMTGTEYAKGFEAQSDTGEPSAPEHAQPDNVQAVSICFAIDHVDGDQTIDKPENYDYWRSYQPHFWGGPLLGFTAPHPRTLEHTTRSFTPNPDDNPLLVDADQRKGGGDENLWIFRRIAARKNFAPGFYQSDICLVNWPMIDYMDGTIIDVTEEEKARHLKAAADLSYTVRGERGAVRYRDSIGIGMYRIDLHPSTGGDNYIDVPSCPFEIPLGALIPQRVRNLIPAGKNIGTTHITNGCYRLHPVEWNIGEVAGMLAAHCLENGLTPHQVQEDDDRLEAFQ
ncbi:MAG: FAD-dependent oxidoreductase, partial [Rhizobium pusense]|nr:FAD-dependent oxidoreductase [Agrobacterium pusense]